MGSTILPSRTEHAGIHSNALSTREAHITEIRLTLAALAFSGIASALLCKDLLARFVELIQRQASADATVQLIFIVVVGLLLFGNFVYVFARLARLKRLARHSRSPDHDIEKLHLQHAPSLSVLVPAYKEDPSVIWKTLLSAALLDYPSKHVVLLIDNPPATASTEDQRLLDATRALPTQLQALLETLASRLMSELNSFVVRSKTGRLYVDAELHNIASLYDACADWLNQQAKHFNVRNHEDRWFIDNILRSPSQLHRRRASELRELAEEPRAQQGSISLELEYRRLSSLFRAELTSFERKKYVNISHEANKAMNLNSYLGLMGRCIREIRKEDGVHILMTVPSEAERVLPDADYVITLDADSLLKTDYALRLVTLMEEPGNESLAVAQTPYSAFPDAPNKLERTAGATTDIQYLVHQGFTYCNATFWVGANALLRKKALEEICIVGEERGYEVRRFIQDRTVIEDTESTVDLVLHGWSLFNYPERLAYSATPPDFGSLLIQRRRWANGGLIILPKLLRYLTKPKVKHRAGHAVMGIHYLTSLATVNIGILLLLTLPVEEPMRTHWLPLAALPYFALYARDLRQEGYHLSDFFQ